MRKRILVGVDFSPASKKALEEAQKWAKVLGAPVTAMHILHPPALRYDKKWEEASETHAREQLLQWTQGYPGVEGKVVWGDPAVVLVGEADPDTLILVGSVGHSTFEHLLFGSTAAKVVRHAPGDVLVIRAPKG